MAKQLYEILYQDFVMTGRNPPTSMFFVSDEAVAKRICEILQAGVDCESGPGGEYFYTDTLVPFFETIAEYKAWLRASIIAQLDKEEAQND